MTEGAPNRPEVWGTREGRAESLDPRVAGILDRYVGNPMNRAILLAPPSGDPATDPRAAVVTALSTELGLLEGPEQRTSFVRTLIRGQVIDDALPSGDRTKDAARFILSNFPIEEDVRDSAVETFTEVVTGLEENPDRDTIDALEQTGRYIASSFLIVKALSPTEITFGRTMLTLAKIAAAERGDVLEFPDLEIMRPFSSVVTEPPPLTEAQQAKIAAYHARVAEEAAAKAAGTYTYPSRGERHLPAQAREEAIFALYRGRSRRQIAEALGVGPKGMNRVDLTISKLIKRGDLPTRSEGLSEYSQEVAKRRIIVDELSKMGVRATAIAEVIGVDAESITEDRRALSQERVASTEQTQDISGPDTSALETNPARVNVYPTPKDNQHMEEVDGDSENFAYDTEISNSAIEAEGDNESPVQELSRERRLGDDNEEI